MLGDGRNVNRKTLAKFIVTFLEILLVSVLLLGVSSDSACFLSGDSRILQERCDINNNLPEASIESGFVSSSSYFSLLEHLQYVPEERDQGVNGTYPHCGNCWVWPGTGIMEIALDLQWGIRDRLSIQYITSCMNYSDIHDPPDWLDPGWWPCCGGSLKWFTDFYSDRGYVIPWSNTNAHWQDGGLQCSAGGSTVSCNTISTTPNYTITRCVPQNITTHGIDQETAINNIKDILHQNRGVYFSYFLCEDNWAEFNNFWYSQPETTIWIPPSSPLNCTPGNCAVGHAVLCVGYNDTDPENSYWIMLNSWGTAHGNRLKGLFRMNMDINYTSTIIDGCEDPPEEYLSFWWETIDVTFEIVNDVAITDIVPSKTVVSQSYSMSIDLTIENQGDFTETFNVTTYYNSTPINTTEVTLTKGSYTTITIPWNTTGVAKGNYTISAYATPVQGETDITENNFTDGQIIIAMIGDITGPDGWPDDICDMRDVGLVARYFGQTVPHAPAKCDLTGPKTGVPDGVIDMRDVGLVARHFGETDHNPLIFLTRFDEQ